MSYPTTRRSACAHPRAFSRRTRLLDPGFSRASGDPRLDGNRVLITRDGRRQRRLGVLVVVVGFDCAPIRRHRSHRGRCAAPARGLGTSAFPGVNLVTRAKTSREGARFGLAESDGVARVSGAHTERFGMNRGLWTSVGDGRAKEWISFFPSTSPKGPARGEATRAGSTARVANGPACRWKGLLGRMVVKNHNKHLPDGQFDTCWRWSDPSSRHPIVRRGAPRDHRFAPALT